VSDDDGDWFEEALGEEESTDRDADDEDDDPSADWGETETPTDSTGESTDESSPLATGDDAGGDAETADAFGDSGTDGEDFGDSGTDGGAFDGASDGESPFGDTGADDSFGGAEGDSAFGDTGTESGDAFGGAGTSGFDDDGGDIFDEGFGEAMGGGGDADFENDDFESDIPRIDLGIEGLDNMIQGGVPHRHLIVIIGGAGTGKTTFGLQYLNHGLQKDDPDRGVFITLEQTYEDIMDTANERGWEFDRHEEEGNLAVIDLDPVEMANSLDNIRGELPELIEDFDADRFVLDSVSLLEMMYDDVARRRTEVFDFTQSLKKAGVTTVLTSEANEDNPYSSRHGIIEYLTDAVFLLRYVRSETQETRLAVEIQKIRNANHSRETKPYEITMDGISVFDQANIF